MNILHKCFMEKKFTYFWDGSIGMVYLGHKIVVWLLETDNCAKWFYHFALSPVVPHVHE